jgi:hypothetical protein
MSSDKENPDQNKAEKGLPLPYEVTIEGSLGLLALGAVGVIAWRKKKEEQKHTIKPEPEK